MRPPQFFMSPDTALAPTADDYLVFNGNADHNEKVAQERWQAKPSLKDPSTLDLTNVSGVPGGRWGYPTDGARIPGKGASYQEDFTGVPFGMEINVDGEIRLDAKSGRQRIYGGVWFDGVQIAEGGITELLDLKDWQGWPVAGGERWWGTKIFNEALRQERVAAPAGARAVWIVRDPAKADLVRKYFARENFEFEVRVDVREDLKNE